MNELNERQKMCVDLLKWASERQSLECDNRPDSNIHKQTLVQTWGQVIRKLEEEIRGQR